MKDGKTFFAKNVVSGAGIMTTYNKLVPSIIAQKHQLKEQLKQHILSYKILYPYTNFAKVSNNLGRYRSENNFIKLSK